MKMITFKSSARTITTSLIAVTAFVACQPRANTAGTADATDMRARSDSQVAVTATPVARVTPTMPRMHSDTGMGAMPHSAMMDSLHTHMTAMAASNLESMMPAHHDRMMRLMQSYRGVVGGAK